MSILLLHSSKEFKKNEIDTLAYISTRGFFANDFPDLFNSIQTVYSRYRGESWKTNRSFEFASNFEMDIETKKHIIIMHAEVSGNYEFLSYSLGICKADGSTELIRRFHFDYVHTNNSSKQKVPVSHLQYGGKISREIDGKLFQTNNIEDWLSLPRLSYPPINLALLLDLTLCEFSNEKTKMIIENPDWRSLIKDNEVFILKNYYDVLRDHLNSSRHKKENLVRDICYCT